MGYLEHDNQYCCQCLHWGYETYESGHCNPDYSHSHQARHNPSETDNPIHTGCESYCPLPFTVETILNKLKDAQENQPCSSCNSWKKRNGGHCDYSTLGDTTNYSLEEILTKGCPHHQDEETPPNQNKETPSVETCNQCQNWLEETCSVGVVYTSGQCPDFFLKETYPERTCTQCQKDPCYINESAETCPYFSLKETQKRTCAQCRHGSDPCGRDRIEETCSYFSPKKTLPEKEDPQPTLIEKDSMKKVLDVVLKKALSGDLEACKLFLVFDRYLSSKNKNA